MNAIAPHLAEWVTMWRATLSGFEVDSMWRTGQQRWRPLYVRTLEPGFEHKDTQDLAFLILGLPSPDGRLVLDVDWYQSIEPAGDTLEVGGEPDSQPVLIDLRTKTQSIIRFCGTPCGFHWGRWLSPTSFVLGGWQDADDFGQWKQGSLSIYSLRDSTVSTYETRILSANDYARYEHAWKRWLMMRNRIVKASRPRT